MLGIIWKPPHGGFMVIYFESEEESKFIYSKNDAIPGDEIDCLIYNNYLLITQGKIIFDRYSELNEIIHTIPKEVIISIVKDNIKKATRFHYKRSMVIKFYKRLKNAGDIKKFGFFLSCTGKFY